jgi:ABC-2 type transport system permease protein
MKAFIALVHRELIEHRGAFLVGPLLLVGIILGVTILAFTVGRIDTRFSGDMLNVLPIAIPFFGSLFLGIAWGLYLLATLFFYCADGFSAEKRNNALLFWKSMPVSDFRILLAKLVAAITILPGSVFAVVLLSMALMLGTAQITMLFSGVQVGFGFAGLWQVFWNVALIELAQLAASLLWYLPFMALVGAMATVVGRWAIPGALLLPALISTLEWVTLGGLHPFATKTWDYLAYRMTLPESRMVDDWTSGNPLTVDVSAGLAYATDLIALIDWLQVGIGAVFAVAVIYLASEYRRRSNDN